MSLSGKDKVVYVNDVMLFLTEQKIQVLEGLCQHKTVHSEVKNVIQLDLQLLKKMTGKYESFHTNK